MIFFADLLARGSATCRAFMLSSRVVSRKCASKLDQVFSYRLDLFRCAGWQAEGSASGTSSGHDRIGVCNREFPADDNWHSVLTNMTQDMEAAEISRFLTGTLKHLPPISGTQIFDTRNIRNAEDMDPGVVERMIGLAPPARYSAQPANPSTCDHGVPQLVRDQHQ